jgi:hypothetical protein
MAHFKASRKDTTQMPGNWKQAEPPASDEPPRPNPLAQRHAIQARIDGDMLRIRSLEPIVESLEKELAEIEAGQPLPPAPFVPADSSAELNTSVVLEAISDVGPARCDAPAGCVISTLPEGEALEQLRARNPQRQVIRVSLETLRQRKVAGHVR